MDVTITLPDNSDLLEMIKDVAQENGVTPRQYITNIVIGWLENRVRGLFINKIQMASFAELNAWLGSYKDLE